MPETSCTSSCSDPQEVPDLALVPGPEQANGSSDTASASPKLLDHLHDSPESLLTFSDILAQMKECPECQTKLPRPLHPNLLIYERIEGCETCTRKEVERAQNDWAHRGYPEINWSDLPNRLERHIPWLVNCLNNKDVPIFRKNYIEARSGINSQNFLIENPRSGYYGPRGEQIM